MAKYLRKFDTVSGATADTDLVSPSVSYIVGGGGKLLMLDTQSDNEELQITGTSIDDIIIKKKPKTYTITYVSEHGTKPADKTVEEGYVLTSADLPTLSESGWTFNGWDKTVGTIVNANMTITASWSEVPTGETWYFNLSSVPTPKPSAREATYTYNASFISNNTSYTKIVYYSTNEVGASNIKYNTTTVYNHTPFGFWKWQDESYRTIILSKPATGDLLTFLQANATKQS